MGFAKRNDRGVIFDIERDAFSVARDARIAGRAIEPIGQRARRHFPGERVLASAGAEKQDIHGADLAAAHLPRRDRSIHRTSVAVQKSASIFAGTYHADF